MKQAWIGVVVLAVAAGCNEPPSQPTEAPPEMANQRAPEPPRDYVATPAGWYHRSCVHVVEDGARIDRAHVVTRRNGTKYQLPKCTHPAWREGGSDQRPDEKVPGPPTAPGWIEAAWFEVNPPAWYKKITANWTVPPNPTGVYPDPPETQVYYTFPGIQNAYYIIQPVLQYGYNGLFGGKFWTIASWHCHDSNDCDLSSSRPTVTAGAALNGSVEASNCVAGTCSWTITANVVNGVSTSLTVTDNDDYTWITGGAVEAYQFTACDQYPKNGVFYSMVSVYDQNLTQVYPSWSKYVKNPVSPSCYFGITNYPTLSDIQLFHNPAPAPNVTSVTTNPTPPRQYQTFTMTINGSQFDPATVEIVYSQKCYPPGTWCSQVYPNTQITTKTATQLVAPNWTFSIADTVRVQVRNGLGGNLSVPYQTIVVNPL